jgi:hypothetical protein
LRYVAEDDYRIERALEGEVHGELSRQLLLKCLKTRPQDRETAQEILNWINQDGIKEALIGEWKMYSSESRGARRSKNQGTDARVQEEKKNKQKRGNQGTDPRNEEEKTKKHKRSYQGIVTRIQEEKDETLKRRDQGLGTPVEEDKLKKQKRSNSSKQNARSKEA